MAQEIELPRNDIAIVSPPLNHPQLACLTSLFGPNRSTLAAFNNTIGLIEAIKEADKRKPDEDKRQGIGRIFLGYPEEILRAIDESRLSLRAIILNKFSLPTKAYREIAQAIENGSLNQKDEISVFQAVSRANGLGCHGDLTPAGATRELVDGLKTLRAMVRLVFAEEGVFPLGSVSEMAQQNPGGSARMFDWPQAAAKIVDDIRTGNREVTHNWAQPPYVRL